MPLNNKSAEASLAILLSKFSTDAHELVRKVHALAAESNMKLDVQSIRCYASLVNLIAAHKHRSNSDDIARQIFAELIAIWKEETRINKERHKNQGQYHTVSLDKRDLEVHMEDHDLTAMMPKSVQHIEVLGVANRTSTSEEIQEGFKQALHNPAVQHIIMPIGPGHFQGFYLSKPSKPGEAYQLELFDPFGPKSTEYMDRFVGNFLNRSEFKGEVIITRTGPNIPQKDSYSCGDYTSIHSHKKMQEFKAPAESYSSPLIKVLDETGNTNHALRKASRAYIAGQQEKKELGAQSNRARKVQDTSFFKSQSTKTSPPEQIIGHEPFHEGHKTSPQTNDEKPLRDSKNESQGPNTRPLTPEDIAFIDEKVSNIKMTAKSAEYRALLTTLIETQDSIFSAAKAVKSKMADNKSLSSEELATLLQAEELQSRM